jgi:AcrR family transcriptional regulator
MATGLRARKKLRTRETIVRVGIELFSERGYDATTLVDVAEAAEIAPSTLHTYFPSKADIVFAVLDAVTESARRRVVGRPQDESAAEAIVAWTRDDLPGVEAPYIEALQRFPRIVAAHPELEAEERLRAARLEDAFADAFARDLGEPAGHVRPRVMATIAMRAMVEVWQAWYLQHADDVDFDVAEVFALKTAYLEQALRAGAAAIETLPSPE